MAKSRTEQKLERVRNQLAELRQKEAQLLKEMKMEEDAKKQSILDRHKISADELMKMIMEKEREEKRILSEVKEGGKTKNEDKESN